MDSLTKVRDVSLHYGVSNRALVYYEEMGLLKSMKIDGYAYRTYDAAALRRLEQILILRRLNIGIKDIALIFRTKDSDMLLDILARKVAGIDIEVALLTQLKQIVKDFIKQIREFDFSDSQHIQKLYNRISNFEGRELKAESEAGDLFEVTEKLEQVRSGEESNEGLYPVRPYLEGHYIDGLPPLRWGQFRDCTWAGAVKLLLDAIGINATYQEIMGFSGACAFFAMTEDWSPAACTPQIAYDPAIVLERALGVKRTVFKPEDLDSQVKNALRHGMPVMLYQPRVEMEWGVLCGYTGDGRFFGRSYFDYLKPDEKDIFTSNNYYLADSYPGYSIDMMIYYHGRTAPFPMDDALRASLEIARDLYMSEPKYNGYFVFGPAAYDILINGLRRDDHGFAALTPYGATGNGQILLTRLIDCRRAAHLFWAEKSQYLPPEKARKMYKVSDLYASITSALSAVLPNDTVASTQNGYPFEAWSAETRARFADTLTICKNLEQQAIDIISDVLEHW
jgi:DNA-binding transcriptional MerR regulator